MYKPKVVRINKNHYEIGIIGNRDPRGYDNNISIEVTKEDKLIISVPKVNRCYKFKEMVETGNSIMIVAD